MPLSVMPSLPIRCWPLPASSVVHSSPGMVRLWTNSKNGCLGARTQTKDHSTRSSIGLRTLVGDTISGLSKGGFTWLSDSSSSGFPGFPASGDRSNSGWMDGYDSFNDGLNDTIANAARNIQMEEDEDVDGDWEDDFEFRPDVRFRQGSTYSVRDLDLRKPAAAKNPPRRQFETTTAEVLKKADFRNVRFLSNFLTEAGIIIKRSQTRISAKAQRKIAREIKTARAFGLMPFTTMGRRPFIFGRSAEEHYWDDGYFGYVKQKDGEPVENEDAEPNVEAV
ncbi:Ribosomal protein S18 [Zea mays]|uniref:Small ribosomal subunit protein bS18c n=1 Tax=Zea mays TaxID=4577 RepID=A0A1D6JYJ2_MAIZE|nr:Ribosomal protein S18 [Zea mays]